MSQPAIQIRGLGKKYVIRSQASDDGNRTGSAGYRRLSEDLVSWASKPFRALTGKGQHHDPPGPKKVEDFWALSDIEFDVQPGEVVGIIGHNGAGKSTLLKILSRITEPSTGRIELNGRVSSLLEVGTGFHTELTGLENIYLNGSILGMTRREIRSRVDEIIAFSGVEKFINTPVKRYSSGMNVRLGFSVAAHLEPEIMIVDEVLAVGDFQFQKKCIAKMLAAAKSGRTILFVSHNLTAVRNLCASGIVLDQGRVELTSGIDDCIAHYLAKASDNQFKNSWNRNASSEPDEPLIFQALSARTQGRQPAVTLEIDAELTSRNNHDPAFIAFDICDASGVTVMQALPKTEGFLLPKSGIWTLKTTVELPPLIPGQYFVSAWLGPHYRTTYDQVDRAVAFEIEESPTPGRTFPHHSEHGYIVPPSTVDYSHQAPKKISVLKV